MFILHNILSPLQKEFNPSRLGSERGTCFTFTLLSVLTHFTSSRSFNLLRCLHTLFDLPISKRRFYTFMASPKLPWKALWATLWSLIPKPTLNGRVLLALDDYINPKTGRKIFGCASFFDHAAKITKGKTIRQLRADSASYLAELFNWCEEKKIKFAIGGDLDVAVKGLIAGIREAAWRSFEDGEITEVIHSMGKTEKAFRLVILRRYRQGDLFEAQEKTVRHTV